MRAWGVLVLLALVCNACAGNDGSQSDVVLRRTIQMNNAPATDAGTVYWGTRTRVIDDDRHRLIVDLDARTVTVVNKAARTYIARTLDEVARKREAGRIARAAKEAPIAFQAIDGIEQIAGVPARQYTFRTDKLTGSVWVSEQIRPTPEWREWEGLISYVDGGFWGGEEIIDAIFGLNGYPLRTVLTFVDARGSSTLTTQVTTISPGSLPADVMKVPDGFRRANELQLPGGERLR